MVKKDVSSFVLAFYLLLVLMSTFFTTTAQSWSNGGYSADPFNPDYGTHDWIAQHALDWLRTEEKQYSLDYLAASDVTDSWAWVRDTITGAWGEAVVGAGDAI